MWCLIGCYVCNHSKLSNNLSQTLHLSLLSYSISRESQERMGAIQHAQSETIKYLQKNVTISTCLLVNSLGLSPHGCNSFVFLDEMYSDHAISPPRNSYKWVSVKCQWVICNGLTYHPERGSNLQLLHATELRIYFSSVNHFHLHAVLFYYSH